MCRRVWNNQAGHAVIPPRLYSRLPGRRSSPGSPPCRRAGPGGRGERPERRRGLLPVHARALPRVGGGDRGGHQGVPRRLGRRSDVRGDSSRTRGAVRAAEPSPRGHRRERGGHRARRRQSRGPPRARPRLCGTGPAGGPRLGQRSPVEAVHEAGDRPSRAPPVRFAGATRPRGAADARPPLRPGGRPRESHPHPAAARRRDVGRSRPGRTARRGLRRGGPARRCREDTRDAGSAASRLLHRHRRALRARAAVERGGSRLREGGGRLPPQRRSQDAARDGAAERPRASRREAGSRPPRRGGPVEPGGRTHPVSAGRIAASHPGPGRLGGDRPQAHRHPAGEPPRPRGAGRGAERTARLPGAHRRHRAGRREVSDSVAGGGPPAATAAVAARLRIPGTWEVRPGHRRLRAGEATAARFVRARGVRGPGLRGRGPLRRRRRPGEGGTREVPRRPATRPHRGRRPPAERTDRRRPDAARSGPEGAAGRPHLPPRAGRVP